MNAKDEKLLYDILGVSKFNFEDMIKEISKLPSLDAEQFKTIIDVVINHTQNGVGIDNMREIMMTSLLRYSK